MLASSIPLDEREQQFLEKQRNYGRVLAESERWAPYVESLEDSWDAEMTAILLENQFRNLAPNFQGFTEVTKTLQVGGYDKYSFPIVRAVYPNLISNRLVSVQPMDGPTSMIFYMDFLYGTTKGNIAAGSTAFDSRTGPTNSQHYSDDVVPQYVVGSTTTDNFTGTLPMVPVRPGTLQILKIDTDGTVTLLGTDNANGTMSGTGLTSTNTINYTSGAIEITLGAALTAGQKAVATYRYDNEATDNVPQVDLQLTSAPVHAKVRKLRSRWSLEAAQNANALHSIDVEAEAVGSLAELIKFELDREVINDLYNYADAGSVTWSKSVPNGISYQEHKLSFIDTLIEADSLIYQATKRFSASFIVAGVGVANVLQGLTPSFQADPTAAGNQQNTGIVRAGTINGIEVYKDPFFPVNKWVMGAKGSGLFDAGYVYCPYVPLFTTPSVILDDFLVRKGIASQYGKKHVNSKMYCTGQILVPAA